MTTKKTTSKRMTKEERMELRAQNQLKPAFTNIKTKVNAKNELVITIPLGEFEFNNAVEGDNYAKLEEKYGTTKNGNVLFGATYDYIPLQKEGFEHIKFNFSMISNSKEVKQEIENRNKKAEMKALAESVQPTTAASTPFGDMSPSEMAEFMEFYKMFKAMKESK